MATLNNEQKSTQELFVDKNSEDQSEPLQPHSLNQLTENVIVNIIRINNGEKDYKSGDTVADVEQKILASQELIS